MIATFTDFRRVVQEKNVSNNMNHNLERRFIVFLTKTFYCKASLIEHSRMYSR